MLPVHCDSCEYIHVFLYVYFPDQQHLASNLFKNVTFSEIVYYPVKNMHKKFFSCKFGNEDFNCTDKITYQMSEDNLCYAFHFEDMQVTRPGYKYGLRMFYINLSLLE